MTIAWGSFGTMWFKPFVMVVVRPPRHTFSFMEKFDSFTISAFPENFKEDITFCGKNSGRDVNKLTKTNLTTEASKKVSAPSFVEAELLFECKQIYFDDFKPENFQSPDIEQYYPAKDYHRMYFGEVLYAEGIDKYL
jgi:flavin reductase (DIM6/NTAB) family NADH-FMN oxidoreductase RutF